MRRLLVLVALLLAGSIGDARATTVTFDDLPLDVIGKLVASVDPDAYIRKYEAALQHRVKAK